jgi:nucleoside-diphosphate-sugar epimerase
VLVTGSSGFLGSSLVSSLAHAQYSVIGLDILPPAIKNECEDIEYIQGDISNLEQLIKIMANKKIDFIAHLAAYWDYKPGNECLYHRVGIEGSRNIYKLAQAHQTKNIIFTSSVSALRPGPNIILSEETPPNPHPSQPYGTSKAQGENLFKELVYSHSTDNPNVTVIRLGGVYGNNCELPPINWLMNRWSSQLPLGRIIPGEGNTGVPYLHQDDFNALIIKCVQNHTSLKPYQVLMGGNTGTTTQTELYKLIRSNYHLNTTPIYLPAQLTYAGLVVEKVIRQVLRLNPAPEQKWMFDLVDNPYRISSEKTQALTDWHPKNRIEDHIPLFIQQAIENKKEWQTIQKHREAQPKRTYEALTKSSSSFFAFQENNDRAEPRIHKNNLS